MAVDQQFQTRLPQNITWNKRSLAELASIVFHTPLDTLLVISQRMREKQSAHLNVIAKSIFKKLVKEQLQSL